MRTAIAGYIIIVSAVYFFILRLTWDPQGWNKVADQLLHYLTPALFVIDWLLFVPKGQVRWMLITASLAFPLVYMLWTLAHGAMSSWYPYPFVDVTKLGYPTVLKNMAALFGVFVAAPLALIVTGRIIAGLGAGPNDLHSQPES